ncbi:MAG: hypothetical protein NTY09_07000 [bacterium]|nr:hypothetical protein [bacterium]
MNDNLDEKPAIAQLDEGKNEKITSTLKAKNRGLTLAVIALCAILCIALGYFVWQRYATLPLEITSVGVSYNERTIRGSLGTLGSLGNRPATSTITVTARTRPGAICTAIIQGRGQPAKVADPFGNVFWEIIDLEPAVTVSVIVNAQQGKLKASRSMTQQVSQQ